METNKIIINKSTVPIGTANYINSMIKETLKERSRCSLSASIVSNPEFLKEGNAIIDFMKPDRIIIGTENKTTFNIIKKIYAPLNKNYNRIIMMDIRSAELTKYAANAMLATKISFMNELSNLTDIYGADIENIRIGIGSDSRIGYHFIYPGCGYGGSCFPKDIKALEHMARDVNYDAELLRAVRYVNKRQKIKLITYVLSYFNDNISGRTFALWGLAFKPGTNDVRQASSRTIMEKLWTLGAKVKAYDPVAMEETKHLYPNQPNLQLVKNKEKALDKSDGLIICTEWKSFRSPNFNLIAKKLYNPVIFDGRNLYDPVKMREIGFSYFAIGRGNSTI